MTVVDDYLATLSKTPKKLLAHMYEVVRETVPETTETVSYAMPAFQYRGHSFLAIIAYKNFLSLYPFCNLDRLGLNFSAYECTKGALHFSADHLITDEFLRQIIAARLRLLAK